MAKGKTKVFIRNLPKVKRELIKDTKKAFKDEALQQRVGRFVVKGIQDKNMGDASKATIAWRKIAKKLNSVHKKHKPTLINATFTGELLNDLRDNVKVEIKNGRVSYIIENSEKKHKLYKIPKSNKNKGKGSGSGKRKKVSYKQISEWLVELGYNYFKLTKEARKKIVDSINTSVNKRLARNRK